MYTERKIRFAFYNFVVWYAPVSYFLDLLFGHWAKNAKTVGGAETFIFVALIFVLGAIGGIVNCLLNLKTNMMSEKAKTYERQMSYIHAAWNKIKNLDPIITKNENAYKKFTGVLLNSLNAGIGLSTLNHFLSSHNFLCVELFKMDREYVEPNWIDAEGKIQLWWNYGKVNQIKVSELTVF